MTKLLTNAALLRENAFGAARVCIAIKAPVGLLSGERSALADGGESRQAPQAATNAKIKFPLLCPERSGGHF